MTSYRPLTIILGYILAMWMFACTPTSPQQTETAVSGRISICVDESFKPIMKAQSETFMGLYEYASIKSIYTTEAEAMRQMFASDSIRFAVISRDLLPAEKQQFEKMKIVPRVFKFAIDAVALITHPNNKDSTLTLEELKEMMKPSGSPTRFRDCQLIFDNNSSSNLTHLQRLLGVPELDPKKVFALKSNEEVLDYVSKHENTVGLLVFVG